MWQSLMHQHLLPLLLVRIPHSYISVIVIFAHQKPSNKTFVVYRVIQTCTIFVCDFKTKHHLLGNEKNYL